MHDITETGAIIDNGCMGMYQPPFRRMGLVDNDYFIMAFRV